MKSIMEEASSIAKAIENGWAKAGKPKEFSIKIFEHPEKNFFGMTTKNAKIAIVFDEKTDTSKQEVGGRKPSRPEQKTSKTEQKPTRIEPKPAVKKQQPARQEKIETKRAQQDIERQKSQQEPRKAQTINLAEIEWTPEMVSFSTSWFKEVLSNLEKSHTKFTTNIEQEQLIITVEGHLFENNDQNKKSARSLAQLLVQTLRNYLKKPLKGYRVTIKTAA